MATVKDDLKPTQYPLVHLVVDMQKRYVNNLNPNDSVAIVSDLGTFIDKTSENIRPIYIRTVDEEMFMAEGEDLEGYSCVFNRKSSDISLEKIHSSPFKYGRSYNIPLERSEIACKLQTLGAKTILVSGLYEDLCVWETAQDAATLGYDVVILKDLCRNGKWLTPESERYQELAKEKQDFMAAHSNIRIGKSTEFVDMLKVCRDASYSVGAPKPEFV